MKKGTRLLARAAVLPVAAGLAFAIHGIASAHTYRHNFTCRGPVPNDRYVSCLTTQQLDTPEAGHHICLHVRESGGNRIRFQIRRTSGTVVYTTRPLREGDPRDCTPDAYRNLRWNLYATSVDGNARVVRATLYYVH